VTWVLRASGAWRIENGSTTVPLLLLLRWLLPSVFKLFEVLLHRSNFPLFSI
jgi:hypothetical protein